ncbi:hypothetical protein HK105_206699 [Polyrhizophydium stewartii]|uniref:HAD-superfamily hydrolase n=1 Tax=Polyrhizophydium stewartii TaxID=2732419 RepID=A0ABR4N2V9_9FUNG
MSHKPHHGHHGHHEQHGGHHAQGAAAAADHPQDKPRTAPAHIGFAFDIDGVLLKGRKVLHQATRSLSLLNDKKVPYILLTNGGGVTEARKAEDLSAKLGVSIRPEQVVLSHSPMRELAARYADKLVLVVGSDSCKDVALSYGFTRPVLPAEVFAWNPAMWPFKSSEGIQARPLGRRSLLEDRMSCSLLTHRRPPLQPCTIDFTREPISAVLVFNDSRDWGRDIQIIIDLMRSKGGFLATESDRSEPQSLPLYFSNSDLIWANDYPVNRFAQGAFRLALETLYEASRGRLRCELTDGQRLVYTKFGKPEHATYKFATRMLHDHAKSLWPNETLPCRTVYAVGDNPASDIHGANKHGWESILVRTGVWRESHGHDHGAGHVVHDVEEAVHLVLKKEHIL